MKQIIKKEISEVEGKYYKVIRLYCDKCKKEIQEGEAYLSVCYDNSIYSDDFEAKYKHFCKNCEKDSMYEMFNENRYTDFDKRIFHKDTKWHAYSSELDLEDWNMEDKQ